MGAFYGHILRAHYKGMVVLSPIPQGHGGCRNVTRMLQKFAAAVLVPLLTACGPPYPAARENGDREDDGVRFASVHVDGHDIHYAEAGDAANPLVLFVHGTPGSSDAFRSCLKAARWRDRAHLVAVDRPGFGGSVDKQWLPGLTEQARLMAAMRRVDRSGKPMIVVGHSLGGTIAYRMAIDYPADVFGIVVIASSVDPSVGGARWYNYVADQRVVSWLLPRDLVRANREIMPLGAELEALAPRLGGIRAFVTVIHGGRDALVSFDNLDYARRHLPADRTRIVAEPDEGHFILWRRPEIIAAEIDRMLDRL